jgi:Zn-finger nucleic acid-binding protein
MTLQCPKCQAEMRQYERNGVTVDQCSDCRGLFLDRGELERLVTAEASWHGQAPQQQAPPPPQQQYQQQYPQKQHYPHKKRRSFLEELFD